MTKAEINALVAVWDNEPGTARGMGITPWMAKHLTASGHLVARSRSISVGRGKTVYSLSAIGREEVLLTGKRMVPITSA